MFSASPIPRILNKIKVKFLLIPKCKYASETDDVIFESINNKGIITINRPKALNALNVSVVTKILKKLLEWENKQSLVIVKGAGEKSFSAGADLKTIMLARRKGDKDTGYNFFSTEYTMDGIIGTYKIPYIAFMDGFTMGGGVGLSVHGPYRVATERTVLAMPETQIGLFPDAGTSYFLPRLKGKLGVFLALSGHRLNGYDNIKAGTATHYVQSKDLPELEKKLLKCESKDDIKNTLQKFSKTLDEEFSLKPHLERINTYFSAKTVEDILKQLKESKSDWDQKLYKHLLKMSPTSMKVSKECLDRGIKKEFFECLQMEWNVAYNTLHQKDLAEGVRAILIDKDKNPKWDPPDVEKVSRKLVEKHFTPAPNELKIKH